MESLEDALDMLEERFWELFADFHAQFDQHMYLEFAGSEPSRSDPDTANPFVKRTIAISATYQFDPAYPDKFA